MDKKLKAGLLGFLAGAATGSMSTAMVLKKIKEMQADDYNPEAYRYRDRGLYSLVVQGDVDHAVEMFREMEKLHPNPGLGLIFWLQRAFRKEDEGTREAQLMREVLNDDFLNKLDVVMGKALVNHIRLEREIYRRRHGEPAFDAQMSRSLEETLGKELLQKVLARDE